MPEAYIGIGHGRRPDGRYDSGTTTGSVHEHVKARHVGRAAAAAFERSGVSALVDDCPDGAHDHAPNYVGSTRRANASGARCALELHFDWSKAPEGGFGIDASDAGRTLSRAVERRYRDGDLPTRKHQRRSLYFVRNTTMPAVIWECGRIKDWNEAELRTMGETIAAGVCDWLGERYVSRQEAIMATLDDDDLEAIALAVWSYRGDENRDAWWLLRHSRTMLGRILDRLRRR